MAVDLLHLAKTLEFAGLSEAAARVLLDWLIVESVDQKLAERERDLSYADRLNDKQANQITALGNLRQTAKAYREAMLDHE
jgi:hypothetical protein